MCLTSPNAISAEHMALDGVLLSQQVTAFTLENYVRIIRSEYQRTPLGCAPGISRFGGTVSAFGVLYAARDLTTAVAETVVRDRFEGIADRRVFLSELEGRSAVELSTTGALRLVDLRNGGCLKLGISTEVTGAKAFQDAQAFSDHVYAHAAIDGVLYSSRLTGTNCVAVFDRAIAGRLQAATIAPLIQLQNIGATLNSLNIELIE